MPLTQMSVQLAGGDSVLYDLTVNATIYAVQIKHGRFDTYFSRPPLHTMLFILGVKKRVLAPFLSKNNIDFLWVELIFVFLLRYIEI